MKRLSPFLACLILAACGPALQAPFFAPSAIGPDQGAARHAVAAGWQTLLVGNRANAQRLLERFDTAESLAGRALLADAAGRDAETGEAWLDLVLLAPEHPLAEVAGASLLELTRRYDALDPDLLRRLPALLERVPGPTPPAREWLRRTLILALKRAGRVDELDRQRAALGRICEWEMAGPFGRFPALEDPQDFWPVERDGPLEPQPDEAGSTPASDDELPPAVPGSGEPGDVFAASTRQFTPAPCVGGLVRIGGEPTRGGVSFGRTWIRVERGTEARITLGTSVSAAVWVDGVPILRSDRFRRFGPDRVAAGVRLAAGEHRILVALISDYSRPAFSLALTDAHGRPIAFEVRLPAAQEKRPDDGGVSMVPARPTAGEHYLAEADDSPDNPLPRLWLALLARVHGDPVEAERRIAEVVERAPDAAALRPLEAAILLDDPALPRKERRDRARAALDRALDLDPETTVALYWLARLEQKERRHREARALLERANRERPESYRWPVRLHKIYAEQGWIAEAEAALEQARRRAPGAPSVLAAELRWAQRRHRLARVASLVADLAARDPDSRRVARRHARAGQLDAAAAEYERLARRRPGDRALVRARAALAASRGAYDEAIALIDREGPASSRELKQRASYSLLAGREEAARQDLARVLRTDPDNTRLPFAVALLEGRVPLQRFAVDPMEEINGEAAGEASRRAEDPGTAAELVLDQYVLDLTVPGPPIERVHTLARVLTKEGVRQWGEVRVPGDAVLLALKVIKPDGHVLEPEAIGGDKDTVSLPGLEVGDHVDFEYLAAAPFSAVYPGAFLGDPFFFRVHDMPVRHSLVIVRAPPGPGDLIVDLHNGAPAPRIEEPPDGSRVYRWEARNLEPMVAEPRSVPPREYLPQLRLGLRLGREDSRRALSALLPERLRPDRAIEDRARALIEPWPAPRDRVRRIFAAVQQDVPASEGSGGLRDAATHVLARGRGSRATLLVALLRAAGIPAEVVAIRPVAAAALERELPDLGEFTYFVVRARPDGRRPIWLDTNYRFAEYDYLAPGLQEQPALVLRPDAANEDFRTPTFPISRERKDIALDLELGADGSVRGRGVEKIRGWMATNLREALVRMQPFQHRQMFELALNRYFPGLTLEEYEIGDLEAGGDGTPLTLRYEFEVARLARPVDDTLVLEQGLYPVRLGPSFLRLAERKLTLLVDALNYARIAINLRLPAGARIATAPEPIDLRERFGRYRLTVEALAHGLKIEKLIEVPPQRIPPEAYGEFAEFCHAVDQREEAETVITLSGGGAE